MADRELPPLRVRILGDITHLKKTIADVEKALNKTSKVTDARRRAEEKHQQLLANRQATAQQKLTAAATMLNNRVWSIQQKIANLQAVTQQRLQHNSNLHNQKMRTALLQTQQLAQQIQQRTAMHAQQMAARQQAQQQSAVMHQLRIRQMIVNNNRANAFAQQRYNANAVMHQQRLGAMQAAQRRQAQAHQQRMQQSARRHQLSLQQSAERHQRTMADRAAAELRRQQIHMQRMASGYYTQRAAPGSRTTFNFGGGRGRGGGGGGNRGGGGGSMGNGLTSRADIYMHANALSTIAGHVNDFMQIGISFREAAVGIEIFAGSAQKADSILLELKDFAVKSPYMFADLAEQTRDMMAYGTSAEDTMKIMKGLGDVAGGNQNRFNHLAYAMAQITSTGKLQGNDLKQLTEQGFNPLKTMADKLGEKDLTRLYKLKEQGLITSKHVMDALLIETSAGGHYAGVMNKMAKELGGLLSRLRETAKFVGLKIFKTMEEDLKNLAKATLFWVEKIEAYIEANPAFVKQLANALQKAVVAFTLFHALGLAVAMLKWNISQLSVVFKLFSLVIVPMQWMVTGLTAAFTLMGSVVTGVVMALMTGNFMGILTSFVGLLPIIGAMAVGGMGIAAFRDMAKGGGGLAGIFDNLGSNLGGISEKAQGFFANFRENLKILYNWIKENAPNISSILSGVASDMSRAFINNMSLVGQAIISTLIIAGVWLENNIPAIVDRIVRAGMHAAKSVTMSSIAAPARSMATGLADWVSNPTAALGKGIIGSVVPGSKLAGSLLGGAVANNGKPLPFQNDAAMGDFSALAKSLYEGFQSGGGGLVDALGGLKLPKFNYESEGMPKAPDPSEMPIPPAYKDYDFSGLKGAGGKGKGGFGTGSAFSVHSSEYTTKWADHMDRLSGAPSTANPQLAATHKTNHLLGLILNALPGGRTAAATGASVLQAANVGSVRIP